MKPQPSLILLCAVATAGALLLGCDGGITQLDPGSTGETELIAAYVDPILPIPAGLRAGDGGDGDKLPVIDGDAQDKEWNAALPLFVYVTGDQAFGGPGFYVELRAIWSDEARYASGGDQNPLFRNFVYFLVRYADETFDIYPDYWRYARPGELGALNPSPIPQAVGRSCDSVIVEGGNWLIENPGGEEDQFSFIFEIEPASGALGTFSEVGCQIACHGASFGPVPTGKLDVWTWRAGRTNAQESTVYPDLSAPIPPDTGRPPSTYNTRIDPETSWPGYMEDMWADQNGIHHDAADPTYPPNRNGYDGQLYVLNKSTARSKDGLPIPAYITEKVKGVKPGTGGTAEPTEPVNGSLPTKFSLWGPTAKQFTACDSVATSRISAGDKWSQNLNPGETDVMPGYLLFLPNGSAADVRAKGDHIENQQKRFPTWVLEVRRAMVTGPQSSVSNADDSSLDPTKEYTFTIAVFNRSSQIHSGSAPLKLRFQPSLYAKTGGPKSS